MMIRAVLVAGLLQLVLLSWCCGASEDSSTGSGADTPLGMAYEDEQYYELNASPLLPSEGPCFRGTPLVILSDGTKRCAPSFSILGFSKCGTTAMRMALFEHPQLAMSAAGEGESQARSMLCNLPQGPAAVETWLRSFVNTRGKRMLSGDKQAASVSQCAMRAKHVIEVVHAVNPAFKFIVLLRNPVDRVQSAYNFARATQCGEGRSNVTIGERVFCPPLEMSFKELFVRFAAEFAEHGLLQTTCRRRFGFTEGVDFDVLKQQQQLDYGLCQHAHRQLLASDYRHHLKPWLAALDNAEAEEALQKKLNKGEPDLPSQYVYDPNGVPDLDLNLNGRRPLSATDVPDMFHFVLSENLRAEPSSTIQHLAKFVGVTEHWRGRTGGSFDASNKKAHGGDATKMGSSALKKVAAGANVTPQDAKDHMSALDRRIIEDLFRPTVKALDAELAERGFPALDLYHRWGFDTHDTLPDF